MHRISDSRGFSSVELMIALSLLSVLMGIGFLSTMTLQRRDRDTKRMTDIDAIHKNVESYFAKKAFYPTLDAINSKVWLKENLPLLDYDSLRDPLGTEQKLAGKPTGNVYSYAVTAADGAGCDNVTVMCKKYTLTAVKQESGKFYAKSNIN